MKIDGNRPAQDTQATEASKQTTADRAVKRTGTDRTGAATSDRVEVSADAQLLAAAIDTARQAPEVRTDLVERMKQKLNSGELDTDSRKLADRILDDLLNR